MKIAFLNLYSGLVNRGIETFSYEVASKLAKMGHEVVVFQGGRDKNYKCKVARINLNVNWSKKDMSGTIWRRFFVDYWSRLIAGFTFKALPSIRKEKFDVIIPLNGGWQSLIIRLATWFYGGKMVVSGQTGKGWDDRFNLYCFPDAFIALSASARQWSKKINPFVRVGYIPNGVDLNKFMPNGSGKQKPFDLKRPVVLCVGALTPTKRIDLVIKAVANLSDASLLLVGDGDLRSELNELGEKLLGNRFKLIKVSHNKMPDVYRVANVFTIPSEPYYSFEIVLVEAMATNVPVVANDDPIRREIVGDAGILVDPTNIDAYTDALEKALNTKWVNRPREQAEKFSWDKIAKQYEQLFKELR